MSCARLTESGRKERPISSRLSSAISIGAALLLYAVFRVVEQVGPLKWSTIEGEGLLKILVWAIPSVLVIRLAYRTSFSGALAELGLWSNPFTGYLFGLVSALPALLPVLAGLEDMTEPRLVGDVVCGPFAEEVLFRGLLFRQLYRRAGRRPLRAMVVSALIFGFAHLANVGMELTDVAQAAALIGTAILGGLLFAWLTYRWESIWPAIGLHSFLNLAWDGTLGASGGWVTWARLLSVGLAIGLTWWFGPGRQGPAPLA